MADTSATVAPAASWWAGRIRRDLTNAGWQPLGRHAPKNAHGIRLHGLTPTTVQLQLDYDDRDEQRAVTLKVVTVLQRLGYAPFVMPTPKYAGPTLISVTAGASC